MSTRFVRTEDDRKLALAFVQKHALPFVMEMAAGSPRSTRQNRLNRQWMIEIAEQLPESSTEEWRGYCKLHHGIPILRNESELFRQEYDEVVKPLPYEAKLKLMMEPFDFGVTRKMTTKQGKQYLDSVQRDFAQRGVLLTDPERLVYGYEDAA